MGLSASVVELLLLRRQKRVRHRMMMLLLLLHLLRRRRRERANDSRNALRHRFQETYSKRDVHVCLRASKNR